MKHLTSGSTTGERCRCGAPIWSYYASRLYQPHEDRGPHGEWPMDWIFVCERGHEQPAKATAAEQLSLLEVVL